jgi:hypothetical protein
LSGTAQPFRGLVDTQAMLGGLSRCALLLTSASAGYPAGLRDLADAPAELRVVGELPDVQCATSIVGTRRADEEALDFVSSLARQAAFNGFTVGSGGAIGIDRAAHEGAIDGEGAPWRCCPLGSMRGIPVRITICLSGSAGRFLPCPLPLPSDS